MQYKMVTKGDILPPRFVGKLDHCMFERFIINAKFERCFDFVELHSIHHDQKSKVVFGKH